MNPVLLIAKKRDGHELTADEIAALIAGYAEGRIPDYQMSAWAMAVYLRGMTTAETAALTEAMLHSGTTLTWPAGGAIVDKHSTGGIGDKTSLILAPLLACCGLRVPMISGRGLGATGGTLDKLEAITGFRTDLSLPEIERVVNDPAVGCVITGASQELAPADRKLYGLRDVTATVASIPLITASIMSKKLAEGLQSLVLDVKFGSGAFMKTRAAAEELAQSLVATGKRMGVATTALLTDMNQPLGKMAGNAVEVQEAIAVLQGNGPADVRDLTIALGAEVMVSAKQSASLLTASEQLARVLDDGSAHERFARMVAAQGGNLDAPRPIAEESQILAEQRGYLAAVDTEALGLAVIEMGGGRRKVGDQIDFSVGLQMLVRVGDVVGQGQPLVRVFSQSHQCDAVAAMIRGALTITEAPAESLPLIVGRIS